jgi:hypothetical protein
VAEGQQPTPEQLLEELRRFKVSDLLVSTFLTLSQLAYAKLDPGTRDLEQAQLAIDAMKALGPVVERAVPAETKRDFDQVVANLQLAYASAASEGGGPSGPVPGSDPGTGPEETTSPAAEDAES